MEYKSVLANIDKNIKATITSQITVRQAFLEALSNGTIQDVADLGAIDDCLTTQRDMLTTCLQLAKALQSSNTVDHLNKCLELTQ